MTPDALSQLIPMLLWLALLVLVCAASVLSGVLCFILKDQQRVKAVDAFLILSTVAIALGYAGDCLPHDKVSKVVSKQSGAKASKESNALGVNLLEDSYVDQLPQPFKFLGERDGVAGFKDEQKSVEEEIEHKIKVNPDNADCVAALAILKHDTAPAEVDKLLAGPADDGKKRKANKLLNALKSLYSDNKEDISPDSESILKDSLPRGWYRNAALKYFYEKTNSPTLATFNHEQEKLAGDYVFKLEIFYVLRTILSCTGFYAIYRFFSNRLAKTAESNEIDDAPRYFPFRNWYGCLLAYFYTQTFASIAVGFVCGFYLAVTHSKIQFASLASTVNASSMFLASIVFVICLNIFIVRASKIESLGAFLSERTLSIRDSILTVSGGFCSFVAVSAVLRIIAALIPGMPTTANNAMQKQAYEALSTPDSAMLPVLIVIICAWGPILEEILFRGLMYPWLRNKIGFVKAIFVTSLTFALWHFDISGLIYYFAMGVTLNFMFERKHNLLVNCAMHMLWNSWVIVWMFLMFVK